MQKNSFVLQTRLNAVVAKLSDKQAGILFKSILNYAENGVDASFEDSAITIAFTFVKQDIDYTAKKYAEMCLKRAESGRLGGQAKQANASKCYQTLAKGSKAKHNDNDDDNDDELVDKSTNKEKEYKEKENSNSLSKRFAKPTLEEIKAYCLERKNNVDPQRFFDFYESKGWKVGSNAMKDWKAAVRTWEHSSTASEQKQSERDRWRMPSPAGKYDV